MLCRNPDCQRVAMPDDKWCLPHGEMLRRIRRELEESSVYGANVAKDDREKRVPTCCHLGCLEPRPRGESFCAMHREDYAVEAL